MTPNSTIFAPMSEQSIHLNSIEDAIEDIKAGKIIIVVDDENRENEGDFMAAAEKVTPEMINFMATHGRGLICTPLTEERCELLRLDRMVRDNSDPMETAFTISVDYKGDCVTTGISAADRSKTIQALIHPDTPAKDFIRPGHIFPLIAKEGGVLRRTGHTEAAIDMARLAGMAPAGVIVEIMNEDGTMARLRDLFKVAQRFDLKIISIEDLVAYRMQHDSLIDKIDDFSLATRFGTYRLRAYQQTTNKQIHLALTKGQWEENEAVLVRVNSSSVNNDILGTLTNNADAHLDSIFQIIDKSGSGAVIFINQEAPSGSLLHRLKQLKDVQSQDNVVRAPQVAMDHRDFGIWAQILHDLKISKIKLITNSTQTKRVGMIGYGLEIVDYIPY